MFPVRRGEMSKKIFVVTGPKGVGKSTALATYPRPSEMERVCVLDTEDSMGEIIELFEKRGHPFGRVIRAYDRFEVGEEMLTRMAKGDNPWVDDRQKSSLIGYYDWLVRELASTLRPKGAFSHFLIDTIGPIEAAMTAAVEDGKSKFGWSGVSAYGRKETEGVRPLYDALLEGIHRTGVKTFLIASHTKPVWIDKRPVPGKVKPGGRMAVLARLSTAMFWLVHNPENMDGAPAALVLKSRVGEMAIEDDRWEPRRVLPEKIPHFSWKDVDRYRESPADFANPGPGETMTAQEREMTSEFFSSAQLKYMMAGRDREPAAIKPQQGSIEVMPQVSTTDKERAREMFAQGMNKAEIAVVLNLPPPLVGAWLK
jgi:hypothetical protein